MDQIFFFLHVVALFFFPLQIGIPNDARGSVGRAPFGPCPCGNGLLRQETPYLRGRIEEKVSFLVKINLHFDATTEVQFSPCVEKEEVRCPTLKKQTTALDRRSNLRRNWTGRYLWVGELLWRTQTDGTITTKKENTKGMQNVYTWM